MNNCPDSAHGSDSWEGTLAELMAKEFPDFCPTCGADLDAEDEERLRLIKVERARRYGWTS